MHGVVPRIKAALLLALVLVSAACVPVVTRESVWIEVPATSEGQAAAEAPLKLQIDDAVRVHTRQGKRHVFRVDRIDVDGFYGTAKDRKSYRIHYANLVAMEVQRTETMHDWRPISPPFYGGALRPADGGMFRGGGGTGLSALGALLIGGFARRRLWHWVKTGLGKVRSLH